MGGSSGKKAADEAYVARKADGSTDDSPGTLELLAASGASISSSSLATELSEASNPPKKKKGSCFSCFSCCNAVDPNAPEGGRAAVFASLPAAGGSGSGSRAAGPAAGSAGVASHIEVCYYRVRNAIENNCDTSDLGKLYKVVDTDADGHIDAMEFAAFVDGVTNGNNATKVPDADLNAVFKLIDTDGNGTIEQDEFQYFFKRDVADKGNSKKKKKKKPKKTKKGRVTLANLKDTAEEGKGMDVDGGAQGVHRQFNLSEDEERRRGTTGKKRKSCRMSRKVAHKKSVFTALQDESKEMAVDADISAAHCTKSDYQGRETAVLVSDLSGFTSMTRKYGITHFASIIVRMRQLVLPSFHRYGVMDVATEGDNFIVTFPDAAGATLAAYEMQQVILKYNASLREERKHYAINLNGVAVASFPNCAREHTMTARPSTRGVQV